MNLFRFLVFIQVSSDGVYSFLFFFLHNLEIKYDLQATLLLSYSLSLPSSCDRSAIFFPALLE